MCFGSGWIAAWMDSASMSCGFSLKMSNSAITRSILRVMEVLRHRIGCCRCYNSDRPEVHTLVASMRSLIDSYGERLLLGEIYLPIDQLVLYYGNDLSGASLPFNFQRSCVRGGRTQSRRSFGNTRQPYHPGRGRTGFWVTTTRHESRVVSAPNRREWPPCYCSRCAEHRPLLWRRNWDAECADSASGDSGSGREK